MGITPPGLSRAAVAADYSSGGMFRIAETVLGADTASIDITGIPADYKSLIVEANLRSTAAATFDTVLLAVNNDTTDANYRAQSFQSSNTTSTAAQNIGAAAVRGQVFATGAQSTTNDFGRIRLVIPDYTSALASKSIQMENEAMLTRNSGGLLLRRAMLCWLSTSVINRLTFTCSANFLTGSSVSVYGVRSANPS